MKRKWVEIDCDAKVECLYKFCYVEDKIRLDVSLKRYRELEYVYLGKI